VKKGKLMSMLLGLQEITL